MPPQICILLSKTLNLIPSQEHEFPWFKPKKRKIKIEK